jgi:hypothetical protein
MQTPNEYTVRDAFEKLYAMKEGNELKGYSDFLEKKLLEKYLNALAEKNLLTSDGMTLTQILLNDGAFSMTTRCIEDMLIDRGDHHRYLRLKICAHEDIPVCFRFKVTDDEEVDTDEEEEKADPDEEKAYIIDKYGDDWIEDYENDELISTINLFFKDILCKTPFYLGQTTFHAAIYYADRSELSKKDKNIVDSDGNLKIESLVITNPTIEDVCKYINKNIKESCHKYKLDNWIVDECNDIEDIITKSCDGYTINGYLRF